MSRHHKATYLSLLLGAFISQNASAMDIDVRRNPNDTLDFALWISSNETTLKDHSISTRIKYRRIGISAYDVSSQLVQFGIQLGSANTNQDDIPATQGMGLTGSYLGVGMRIPVLQQEHWRLRFDADYIYETVGGSTDTQNADLEWHEYDAGMLLSVPLGYFELLGGLYFQKFDVTQTTSGTIQQTLFLENDNTLLRNIGINYFTGPGEHVGMSYHSGASRGVQFEFQKLF